MELPRGDWSGDRALICSDLGCGADRYAKGLCRKCYERRRNSEAAARKCTRDGCERNPRRRTLCARHYREYLRTKSTKWPMCSVSHCCERPKKGSKYCGDHDSVYGEGVSKHIRQSLTPDAILRSVLATQEILELANFPVLSLDSHRLD